MRRWYWAPAIAMAGLSCDGPSRDSSAPVNRVSSGIEAACEGQPWRLEVNRSQISIELADEWQSNWFDVRHECRISWSLPCPENVSFGIAGVASDDPGEVIEGELGYFVSTGIVADRVGAVFDLASDAPPRRYVFEYAVDDGHGQSQTVECAVDIVPGPCGDADGDGCDDCLPGGDRDADEDGTSDACDRCPGGDDRLDADLDGTPDPCDVCGLGRDDLDADADGVPDACDACPMFDDGAPFELTWPVQGEVAREWVVTNYVDLDDDDHATVDFTGAAGDDAKTYDGHAGVDIAVPNFRAMDAGFPVFAATPGEVLHIHDGEFDRNTECGGTANVVHVQHPNGYTVIYAHFRSGSIAVEPGDAVEAGDVLGMIGSSGCSTGPHLHLEIRDCRRRVIEPFLEGLWTDPPAYETPLGIMDVVVQSGAFEHLDDVKDPGPENAAVVTAGEPIGLALVLAGGQTGQTFGFDVLRPDGSPYLRLRSELDRARRQSYWWWNRSLAGVSGDWTLQIRLGDSLADAYVVAVEGAGDPPRHAIGVLSADWREVFDGFRAEGYWIARIDGYRADGRLHYNAVFEPAAYHPGWGWVSWSITADELSEQFAALSAEGRHLAHVDTYASNGGVRYAAIWADAPIEQALELSLEPEAWADRVAALGAAGFAPTHVSVATPAAGIRITGLFAHRPDRTFDAAWDLDAAALAGALEADDGLAPVQVDGWVGSDGAPRFALVRDDRDAGRGWSAAVDLAARAVIDVRDEQWLRVFSGYEGPDGPAWVGLWSAP